MIGNIIEFDFFGTLSTYALLSKLLTNTVLFINLNLVRIDFLSICLYVQIIHGYYFGHG